MDVNSAYLEKCLILIGENAIDIALYISKMCSFEQKVLFLDLSKTGMILEIVLSEGHMENQNIHYAKQPKKETLCHYDLIILFSDEIKHIPNEFYCSDIFIFINSRKSSELKLARDIKLLEGVKNLFIVIRGHDYKNMISKRIYVITVLKGVKCRILFIDDNKKDIQVFRQMEYSMVFLYDGLSDDLKEFLNHLYKRIINKIFICCNTDNIRFKWIM